MQQRVKVGFAAAFIIGLFAAVSIGAGAQLTGGPGLTKVVHTGGILSGSGTTAAPLAATITTGTGLTGTGSAGSPLASTVSGGVSPARQILTGTGLTGGGDLSADRTIALANTAVSPGTYTYSTLTVDGQGRLTSASNGTTPAVASRQVLTGTGLSGGGDLSADRTISLANTAVGAGTYTYMTATVDAQGRLTSASSGAAPAVVTRQIIAGTGLSGGGDLSADRTLSLASINAATILGNNTGGSTTPSALTASQVRTLLALAAIATSGSGADLSANSVANAALGTMPTLTVKANTTGGTATPSDVTLSSFTSTLFSNDLIRCTDIGDGRDGTPVFDGINTFTWATLAGSTYTLTGPVFWAGATINSGITIKPDGWSIRSNANIVNNGDINVNGNGAITTTGGLITWSTASRDLPGGSTGGNGSSSAASITGAPQVFSATAAGGGTAGGTAGIGGTGTAGGLGHGSGGGGGGGSAAGGGNAGGNGGGLAVSSLTTGGGGHVLEYQIAITGRTRSSGQFSCSSGGGGGGAGGGAGAGAGGAGGGGAGWMVILAQSASGSGTWRAVGGAGTNGATGAAGAGGGGAGSGGGGGLIAMRICTGAYPTVDISGGAGGSGGGAGAGAGAGANGTTGGTGYRIKL